MIYDADMAGFDIDGETWDVGKIESLGFNDQNYSIRNRWNRASSIQEIKDRNLEEVTAKWGANSAYEIYYLNNQFIMTP